MSDSHATERPRAATWAERLRRQPVGLTILYAFSVLVLLFVVAPTVMVFLTSVNTAGTVAFPPKGFTLEWYTQIPETLWQAGLTSLILALITAAGSLLLGVPAGFALARGRFRAKDAYANGLRSPLSMPQVVIGVAVFQYYISLNAGGVRLTGSMVGLALAHMVIATPFVITTIVASLERFDRSVEEAAAGLGASGWNVLRHVTLPLLKPAVFAAGFFAFLISFDNVPISLFLAGGGVKTLPVELFFSAEFRLEPEIFAASSIVVLFAIVATIVWDRVVGLRLDSTSR